MRLLAIGRAAAGPERELFERYAKRLSPTLGLSEFPDGRGSPGEIRRREGKAILDALSERAFAVALDQGGETLSSEALAAALDGWLAQGRPLCFLIGGAEGLDATVLARADRVLSLGSMTWPHLLARAMLSEQLYRARAIAAGHPYHRAGRP